MHVHCGRESTDVAMPILRRAGSKYANRATNRAQVHKKLRDRSWNLLLVTNYSSRHTAALPPPPSLKGILRPNRRSALGKLPQPMPACESRGTAVSLRVKHRVFSKEGKRRDEQLLSPEDTADVNSSTYTDRPIRAPYPILFSPVGCVQ